MIFFLTRIIIFWAFFQGAFEIIGFPIGIQRVGFDLLIYILFASVLFSRKGQLKYRFPFLFPFLIYTLAWGLSVFYNNSPLFNSFSFFRHTLIAYLFFISIYNFQFPSNQEFALNRLLMNMLLVQIGTTPSHPDTLS